MKKAVIIGAGNIGRGFIGQIMYEAGYEICYIDVVETVVNALNERHEYPLEIVSSGNSKRMMIGNVRAVNGNDHEAAAREIAGCDICVTCVGAKAIKFVMPYFIKGVKIRHAESGRPINLLICENLMDADKYIHSIIEPELTEEELSSVGLVETSVGRMVPVPDKDLLAKDPLIVRAEAYSVLPCDKAAFKEEVNDIPSLIPIEPFRFVIERKLYIHNMGHAVCAYLGKYMGYKYIYEAIANPYIRLIVREAMTSSAVALSKKYDKPLPDILLHTEDLIRRFGNSSLGDTCERVGNDVPRKLAREDRLTGAAMEVLSSGGHPVFISVGAAAALYDYNPDAEDPKEEFEKLCGTDEKEYIDTALLFFDMFKKRISPSEIIKESDRILSEKYPRVI